MTPKKKSSLDKKQKKAVAKYESDLEEYLGKLDDEKRCKYDQVIFLKVLCPIYFIFVAKNGEAFHLETRMVGKWAESTKIGL